jgi:hypothetical protein
MLVYALVEPPSQQRATERLTCERSCGDVPQNLEDLMLNDAACTLKDIFIFGSGAFVHKYNY